MSTMNCTERYDWYFVSQGTKEEVKARIQAIKEGKDIPLVTNDNVPKNKRKPQPPIAPPDDGIVFASGKPKSKCRNFYFMCLRVTACEISFNWSLDDEDDL